MFKDYVDALLGHVPSGVDQAYFRNLEETLKQEYIQYLPHLTFSDEIVIRSLNTEDTKKLDNQDEIIKQQATELQELKEQMATIHQLLKLKDAHGI